MASFVPHSSHSQPQSRGNGETDPPPRSPPPSPPHHHVQHAHGHHHRHGHHNDGTRHYGVRTANYMNPLHHLSSVRRLNSVDITQTRNIKMNFRDYNDADASFYNERGYGPHVYHGPHNGIGHGHGASNSHMMPPPRDHRYEHRPQPGYVQHNENGPRPGYYQPFHFYNEDNPNNCSIM